MSGCIPLLSNLHSPVFLLNSCLDRFSAPNLRWDPLFRSYRVNLPSSLTTNHSSALVYSTRSRVSVYGTGDLRVKLADFLGGMITCIIRSARRRHCTIKVDSRCVLYYNDQHLHSLTDYSVSRQHCHSRVSASPHKSVTEY